MTSGRAAVLTAPAVAPQDRRDWRFAVTEDLVCIA
jgi:hypothetical protein